MQIIPALYWTCISGTVPFYIKHIIFNYVCVYQYIIFNSFCAKVIKELELWEGKEIFSEKLLAEPEPLWL